MSTNFLRSVDENGGTYINFNQNYTSLAIGGKQGYVIVALNTPDQHLEVVYKSLGEEVCLIERLFGSSLIAVVAINAPRKLRVCHFKRGTEICNYLFSNTVLAVKLNRERLVVCLEESLYIHNISDMKVVHTIRETPSNPSGICALTSEANSFLAYPGSVTTGEVQIFDAVNLTAKGMIHAHDSPLAAIAFSKSGEQVATASEKGTVIRVFDVHKGSKLFEFRRGVKRCVTIASLSFSTCSQYLVCSSNTETVHIFKLENPSEAKNSSQTRDDWMGYIGKAVSNYLPTQVADVLTQGRAFASAVLPTSGVRCSCGIITVERNLRLLVASQEGFLYVYSFSPIEGGECQLIKKHDLRNYDMPAHDDESTTLGVPPNSSSPPTSGPSYASAVKGDEN